MPTPSPQLPPEIQIRTEDRGVRYILPIRQLGSTRWVGLFPIALGLFGVAFMIFWIISASGILENGFRWDGFDLVRLLFGALGIPGLLGALVPVVLGLWLIFPNHSEILLTESHLCAIEYGGPFRWTFRRRLNAIKKLRVALRGFDSDKKNPQPDLMAKWSAIKVEGDYKKTMVLAPGYPREMLIPLAQDLSRRCALADPLAVMRLNPAQRPESTAPVVDIEPLPPVPSADGTELPEPPLPQPPASKIMLLQEGDITTLLIPPQGFTGNLRGLLFFSLLWCGIVGFITVGMLFGEKDDFTADLIPLILFGLLFWGVGIGLFLLAFHLARRKAVFVITADTLTFSQVGPLRQSEKQWPTTEITAVGVGDSNTSVNNVPLKQMQIHLLTGHPQGLFTGRDTDELNWLASVLRQTLAVPSTPNAKR